MKRMNKFIPLMLGAALSLSMTGTAMAGAAQVEVKTTAAAQKQNAGSSDQAAGKKDVAGKKNSADAKDKASDKKEMKEFFGKIKKINKDSLELEIETALAEDTTETKDEKSAKKDGKGNAEEKKTAPDTKTEEKALAGSEILKLVLDGKTATVHLEKDTKILREAVQNTDVKDAGSKPAADKADSNTVGKKSSDADKNKKADDSKQPADKKNKTDDNKQQVETIKLEELKEGDIIKITVEDEKKVTDVTVLANVQVLEKADKKADAEKSAGQKQETPDKKTSDAGKKTT